MVLQERRALVAPKIDARQARPSASMIGSHRSCRGYDTAMAPAACACLACTLRATSQMTNVMNVSVMEIEVSTDTVRPKRSVSGGRLKRFETTARPAIVMSQPAIAIVHVAFPIKAAKTGCPLTHSICPLGKRLQ